MFRSRRPARKENFRVDSSSLRRKARAGKGGKKILGSIRPVFDEKQEQEIVEHIGGKKILGSIRPVFDEKQEQEIVEHIKETETRFYGLSKKDVRPKAVGSITSAERGALSTVVVCMSAGGSYVPPMIIFPRVRMKEELMDGAPPGTEFACHPSGWMHWMLHIFTNWFEHFVRHGKPSAEDPCLLILDGHGKPSAEDPCLLILDGHMTHTRNLDFINSARDKSVTVLCLPPLPPHCSHKLQPLDVSFMAPLNHFYIKEVELFLKNNPGRTVSQFQIAKLFGAAHLRAALPSTAVNGFRHCGISPYNPNIFSDADFVAADVTNLELKENDAQLKENDDNFDSNTPDQSENQTPEKDDTPKLPAKFDSKPDTSYYQASTPECQPSTSFHQLRIPDCQPSTSGLLVSPREIIPIPKIKIAQKRGNGAKGSTAILTDSPFKRDLEAQRETPKRPFKRNLNAQKREYFIYLDYQLAGPVAKKRTKNTRGVLASYVLLLSKQQHYDWGLRALKTVPNFSLLLSKQQHYDWGLRALKTVLNGCSQGIKEYKKSPSYHTADNNFEFALVIKALKMDTLSKLTFSDHEKFEALIADVFQEDPRDINEEDKLKTTLAESCKELGFYINQRQLEKCLELHEQLKQRMGVAIIGPASSGKSTVKRILFHALNKMGHTLKEKVFNPKSLPRVQLLGQIDPDTRQWSDGVLSLYSTQVTAEAQDVWSWITCDGDIDPEWVESLNSVLDDNRLLSLPSGWRIQFGPNVNFIFESHELRNASPATISRMGIDLESFYNDYFYRAVNWILNEGELVIPCSKIGVVKTALSQLVGVSTKGEFAVNLINALGGQLQVDFKEIFAQQVFNWMGETAPPVPDRIFYNAEQGIIESYFTKSNNNYERNISPLIRTAQVSQAIDVLGKYLTPVSQAIDVLGKYLTPGKEQHFLLIGSHGTAKSFIIEHLVKTRSEIDLATVHCSAYVTPHHVIHKFKQSCIIVNSSKGRVFKPKKGHLVMYFKNVHLLKPDNWGTNMLIEFLQQVSFSFVI
ncbi:DDE superfamily endonuclease [Popillia japonica]|uniref:DDE superfamily endonuclease n=1 Tax=Popillia japonica TaxID=7064 RepID=A0AAW1MHG1_POPJA